MRELTLERRLLGGLRLAAHKQHTTTRPIHRGFVPRELIIPLADAPLATDSLVRVGERVLRGQPLAARGEGVAMSHASSSGQVVAIEARPMPGPPGTTAPAVVIHTDGRDQAVPMTPLAGQSLSRNEVLQRLQDAGLVGLGGALFPTADKLRPHNEQFTLILNGAECEPYISCDDMLMREQAREVLDGAALMCDFSGAGRCIVAIERDKPEAISAIAAALNEQDDDRFELAQVPTVYPAGGERQLIQLLAGIEVPSGRYPTHVNFLCQNVGTAVALAKLYAHGEPLTSRIVTVTGQGVSTPQNIEAPIGTPIAELIAAAGGYRGNVARLIMGGSMMGVALDSDAHPVTKATNCVVAAAPDEVYTPGTTRPCIRCGDCARVCPARLLPQELIRSLASDNLDGVANLGLADCIECGCCDVVCPSHIPLTERFRAGKHSLAVWAAEQAAAARAEARVARRQQRLEVAAALEDQERRALLAPMQGGREARQRALRAVIERAQSRSAPPHGDDV
jgi:electron transport complex protein RnfC